MKIGERIKQIRKQLRLTMVELNERGGVKPAHQSQIENNITSPSSDTLLKIASALGVYPPMLLYQVDETTKGEPLDYEKQDS